MYKKNRISLFFALLFAIAMLFTFVITAAAEDVDTAPEAALEDTEPSVSADADDTPASEDNTSHETVFSRLWEYVQTNCSELLAAGTLVVSAFLALVYKKGNGSFVLGVGKMLSGQKAVIAASDDSTAATKQMIESQKILCQQQEILACGEEERNKVVSSLMVEVMTLIEIQHITCLNNANIPQPIKDLVTSMHAKCVSMLNSDEKLKSTYQEIRSILGIVVKEENCDETKDT